MKFLTVMHQMCVCVHDRMLCVCCVCVCVVCVCLCVCVCVCTCVHVCLLCYSRQLMCLEYCNTETSSTRVKFINPKEED